MELMIGFIIVIFLYLNKMPTKRMIIETRCIFMEDTQMCETLTEENNFNLPQILLKIRRIRHKTYFGLFTSSHLQAWPTRMRKVILYVLQLMCMEE